MGLKMPGIVGLLHAASHTVTNVSSRLPRNVFRAHMGGIISTQEYGHVQR